MRSAVRFQRGGLLETGHCAILICLVERIPRGTPTTPLAGAARSATKLLSLEPSFRTERISGSTDIRSDDPRSDASFGKLSGTQRMQPARLECAGAGNLSTLAQLPMLEQSNEHECNIRRQSHKKERASLRTDTIACFRLPRRGPSRAPMSTPGRASEVRAISF